MTHMANRSYSMIHDEDPKEVIKKAIGDHAAKIHPIGAQILVGVYVRPEMTSGGLIINTQEDLWQGKIGLILDMGPLAFTDDAARGIAWGDRKPKIGDWITFRVGETLGALSGKNMLRFLDEQAVRAIIDHPDALY